MFYCVPWPSKICVMLTPLQRCLLTFVVLWLFLTVLFVGLQCVIVIFPDHTHLLFSYSSITLIKIQQKSGIEVFRGVGGVIMQFQEHRM